MTIAKVLLYKSTLSTISSILNEAQEAEQTRASIVEHLSSSNGKSKKRAMEEIERLKTLEEIRRQTEVALSKYEKLASKSL